MKNRLAALAAHRLLRGNDDLLAALNEELRAAFIRWDLPAAHRCAERIYRAAPSLRKASSLTGHQALLAKIERFVAEASESTTQ